MAMMSVMQPKKVKDVREPPSAVEDWEVCIKNVKVEHDIGLDENIKIALMTSFLPTDLQDHVFQWTDGKMKFPEIKDRVVSGGQPGIVEQADTHGSGPGAGG